MRTNTTIKLGRTALKFTLFLIIFNLLIPFSCATQWSPATRLTWDDSLDWAPSIAQAQDGRIWIVWQSYEINTKPDIVYKIYNESSTFPWSPIKRLTTDQGKDILPSITTTSDGNIWVVWSSNRDENFEIYYKIYNGSSWSPDERLTMDSSEDKFPSVMEDKDGDIWVVWSSNRTGNFEIHYQAYNGSSWQPCGQLTLNPERDVDPSIMQDRVSGIWIVWTRDEQIFYKIVLVSKVGGTYQLVTLIDDTPFTDGTYDDRHPSIMQAQDGEIWITWDSERETGFDIYCKIYGMGPEEMITYNNLDDIMPAIMQAADGTIWVTWTSNRLDNFDIYYKTDSLPQHSHDIAIISVTSHPNRTYNNQDSNITIEVVPQNQGLEFENFQVDCYVNSTLIGSETTSISPGQITPLYFTWNTLNVTPGRYTIIANASIVQGETDTADNINVDTVIVTIPGDVDGDGDVDASDLYDLSMAYGSELGDPNWNLDCDFNLDNKVDGSDLFELNRNFGVQLPFE